MYIIISSDKGYLMNKVTARKQNLLEILVNTRYVLTAYLLTQSSNLTLPCIMLKNG